MRGRRWVSLLVPAASAMDLWTQWKSDSAPTESRNTDWKLGSVRDPDGRFTNAWTEVPIPPPLDEIVSDLLETRPDPDPRDVQTIRVTRPQWAEILQTDSSLSLLWLGHSTCYVRMAGGVRILTDPIFSERASPVQFIGPKRFLRPVCAAHEIPTPHMILLSHDHHDHLDEDSIASIEAWSRGGPGPVYVMGLGVAGWFRDRFPGIGPTRLVELDWWQTHQMPDGSAVQFLPAQHWSSRCLADYNRRLWGGFLVTDTAGRKFYYAGDTGFSQELFAEIGRRVAPVDLAAIPIGAYEPRWRLHTQHVDPLQAYQIHSLVGSQLSIGVHWGTFVLSDEPVTQPQTLLQDIAGIHGGTGPPFRTLAHGESVRVP